MHSAEVVTPLAALAFALLGGAHCAAMCGGIAAALALSARRRRDIWLQQLGKLLGYVLLGALVGALGAGLLHAADLVELGRAMRGVAGALLLLLGLRLLFALPPWPALERFATAVWRRSLAPLAQRLRRSDSTVGALALGLVWGWLPCGLVWTALLGASATGDAGSGALLMAAFGLGTIPALGLGGLLFTFWRLNSLAWRRLAGALLIVAGGWTALQPWLDASAGHSMH